MFNKILFLIILATVLIPPVYGKDATALRDKLIRFYKLQEGELRTEQRQDLGKRGEQSLRTQQRLKQKFQGQRREQRRLQRRQFRQTAPSSGFSIGSGTVNRAPGRPRPNISTLQRFERQIRQQRLQFKTQRRGWR